MKKTLIVLLAVVNVVALLGLIAVAAVPPAKAQPFAPTDYVAYVGSIEVGQQALYIIDLSTQRMGALSWDDSGSKKGVVYYRGRDLKRDFRSRQKSKTPRRQAR